MTDIFTRVINQREIEIAKAAIIEGLDLELISKLTGLDIETIEALKESESYENDEE